METRGILFIMASVVLILILLGGTSGYAQEVRGITNDTIIMGYISADTGPIAQDSHAISEGIRF